MTKILDQFKWTPNTGVMPVDGEVRVIAKLSDGAIAMGLTL